MLSVSYGNNYIIFNEKHKRHDLEVTCDLASNNLTAEAIDDNHNERVVPVDDNEKYLNISTNIQEKRKMVAKAVEKLEDLKDQWIEILSTLKKEIRDKEIKELDIDDEMINGLENLSNPLSDEIYKVKELQKDYYGI